MVKQPTQTLTDLAIDFVSLTAKGADQDAHVMLAKSAPDPVQSQEDPMADKNPTLPESVEKAFEGVTLTDKQKTDITQAVGQSVIDGAATAVAEADAARVAAEKSKGDEGEPKPEPVTKSEGEIALEKRLADVESANEKLTTDAAIAVEADAVRKAYPNLAVDPVALGGAMHRMEVGKASPEDMALVRETLAGAEKASATASILTREIGSSVPSEASTQVDAIAKGLKEADPELSGPAAIAKAARTPEGAAAYEANQDQN